MGWRPSSWWARSQDREPTADAPVETSSVPVAEPGPSAAGAWRDLPVLRPVTATPVQRVADGADFAAGLAAHADPRFLQRLSHVIDPSVGGLVDGLAVPGEPHRRDAGPDLAVPARPIRPVPRVQRRLAEWQGAEELPTVRWELPDLDDHQPEVDVPSGVAESPPAPHTDALPVPAIPSPRPIGPSLSRPAVQRAVSVEPPRAPRAETPVVLQRQLSPVAAPVSPVHDTPSAPSAPVDPVADSVVDDKPVPLPPVADSPSPEPESHDQIRVHDLERDHDAAAVTGWTEVALPVAPTERALSGSPPVQRSILPVAPGPGPDRVETQPEPRPEARPVTKTEPERPAVQRQPSATAADTGAPRIAERPVEQPTPVPATEAPSAPSEESRAVGAPLAVGVPLVQRLAADEPVGGSAMSFTSMFARPSPTGEFTGPDHVGPHHDVPDHHVPDHHVPDHNVASLPSPEVIPAPSPIPTPVVVARSVIVGAPSVTSVTRAGQSSSGPVPTPSPAPYTPATTRADQTPAAPVTPVVVSRSITAPALPTTTQSGFAMAALQRRSEPGHTQPGHTQLEQTLPAAHAAPGQVLHRLSLQRDPADEAASAEPTPSPTEGLSPAEASGTSGADSGASAPDVAPAPAPGAAPAAGGAAAPADIDEMARRLYEPLVARIRAELWLDRERSGVFGHG